MNNNTNNMQKIYALTLAASLALIIASCGSSKKDDKAAINDLKAKIEKLKKEKNGLDAQIRQSEEQLAKLDPDAVKQTKLVAVDTVRTSDFAHYIDLQGKVDADAVAYVTPKGLGGQITAIYVKLGDQVRKGQTILKLNDVLARQQLIAAQQQVGAYKAQLAQAQSIYDRQQNLWKQNIGTEVQVLNAKTAVESLQSQVSAYQAQADMAQEQLNETFVKAEIDGTIDQLVQKVGELYAPQNAADPRTGIRIVNNKSAKIVTEVPETYVARVQKGDSVLVSVPEIGKTALRSVISVVGSSINPTSRSFVTEARLPYDANLKPNQLATMRILDYKAKNAVTVPINVVQTDEKGKYVYVMVKEKDKWVARKKTVIAGESYGQETEIKSGLAAGDVIITEGYQTVYDGQAISTK